MTATLVDEFAPVGRKKGFLSAAARFFADAGVPTDAQARRWIVGTLWPPDGRRPCPSCGRRISERQAVNLARGRKIRCVHCAGSWRPFAGTALSGSHARPAELVLVAALLHHGLSLRRIAAILGRDLGSVRSWEDRLAEVEGAEAADHG